MKRVSGFHVLAVLDLVMIALSLLMTAVGQVFAPLWPSRFRREPPSDWYLQGQEARPEAETHTPAGPLAEPSASGR